MRFFLSVLLSFCFSLASVKAEISQPNQIVLLMVGVKPAELADYEKGLLHERRLVEVAQTDSWKQHIISSGASEIILKHNTGFVGLYTPNGSLVKEVDLHDSPQRPDRLNNPPASPVRSLTYQEQHDYGYLNGGKVDPYQPVSLGYEPRDNKRLDPGYGYNQHTRTPPRGKRSGFIDFLNFAPLDVVTPFNYPGHFDQTGISTAYTAGVIPHVGGLVARWMRARAENRDYNYYKQTRPPAYIEQPVTYYRGNSAEPTNPLVTDPNIIRSQSMPQSFQNNYPNYGYNPPGAGSTLYNTY